MWKFDDRNGDKVIDDSDMSVIGNANPDFYGGLNNQFKYKGVIRMLHFGVSPKYTRRCNRLIDE